MNKPRLSPDLKIYSTKQKPGKSRRTPMQLLALRIKDITTILRHRYGFELPDDDAGRDDLKIALNHLACLPHPQRKMQEWARLWAPWITIAEIDEISGPILLRPRCWTADKLAWDMGVTKEERRGLAITTIGAIGETKATRARERKQRDRERKAKMRRAKGAKPRKLYEAQSTEHAKPWIAEGVSRRTWYRRRGTGMFASATNGTSPATP